jgi:hypothetical protein
MKTFLTKYIVKAFVVVLLVEGVCIGFFSKLSNGFHENLEEVLFIILITAFVVHLILFFLAMIYVFMVVQDVSAKKPYYWSLVFIVLSVIECFMVSSYLPKC